MKWITYKCKMTPEERLKKLYCIWHKIFDSNVDFDEPLSFVLGEGGVIDGWERGLVGTCPGEKLELTIPPELGYGEEGNLEFRINSKWAIRVCRPFAIFKHNPKACRCKHSQLGTVGT